MKSTLTQTPALLQHGQPWLDTDGQPIQAHGGGVLERDGVYYWYGENKAGPTTSSQAVQYRVDFIGISCYQSTDLLRWEHLGLVLKANETPGHALHPRNVGERPKVVHCPLTGKYVMWLHLDDDLYQLASVAVAVADQPQGPFELIKTFRPQGRDSRDQTVYIDPQGNGWHLCSTDINETLMLSRMTPDFTGLTDEHTLLFPKRSMEAHAIAHHQGRLWYIASGCTGWHPNEARAAVAEHIQGPWEELGNPCVGPEAELTFRAQSTFLLPLRDGRLIAMFDRWNPQDLGASQYVWLPVDIEHGTMKVRYRDAWSG